MITDLFISIGNHLWQSTLFALCVAALAVAFRGIPARTRFWMWFAGLLKFLVPFSLLLSLGAGLAPKHTGGTQLQPAQFYSVDEVSQPFTYTPPSISIPAKTALLTNRFPAARVFMIVSAIWAAGFLAALCFWILSWRGVKAVLRNASPEPDGMEAEILGRLRERMKVKPEVALLISDSTMEPGIVGVWRSTLVWPRGISERLNEEQIEAVIAHELAHVNRRDNLTAALAMLGTAIFWFYPLVGWMKARMLDTRERACDEAVLLIGHEPEVYASSILRACEFSIESPLACVSGITGSDLKERVRRIMCGNPVRRMSRVTTIVLTALCATTIIAPIGFGFLDAPRASAALLVDQGIKPGLNFEVASIKQTTDTSQRERYLRITPGRFSTVNIPLRDIIMFAFDAKSPSQLTGYPDWATSTHFDIEAKEDDATAAALEKLPTQERAEQIKLLVQSLLVERFQLKVRRDVQEIPVYALVIAKGGPKLTATVAPPPPSGPRAAGAQRPGFWIRSSRPGEVQCNNATLDVFAGESFLGCRKPKGVWS
jgi:bla regulator protein BlaR1